MLICILTKNMLPSLLIMFIPSTFKRPVSSWKALNLRKTLLMASSVRLKPLNCSRLPCVYAQETLTFLLTQKKTCVKNYVQKECNYPKKKGIKDECSRLLEASTMKSRRGFAIQRLMNAMRQAHADGWFIVFDTLTLADDRLEAFYDNPNA